MADRLLDAVLSASMELTDASAGWIVQPVNGDLTVIAARSSSPTSGLLGTALGPEVGAAGFVASNGQSIALSAADRDRRYAGGLPLLGGAVPTSAVAVPCADLGATVAVLELVDSASGRFGIDEVEVLSLFGAIVGAAVGLSTPTRAMDPDELAQRLKRWMLSNPATYDLFARGIETVIPHG